MPVYDKNVCVDLGSEGSHCAHTLIKKTQDIPKAQWDLVRVGWFCTDSTGFNDTETAIDQLCVIANCDYKTREEIAAAITRMRVLEKIGARAKKKHRKKLLDAGINLEDILGSQREL